MNKLVKVLNKHLDGEIVDDEYTSLCPFHKEEEPSFGLNLTTGGWNCFGCKEHGNAFELLRRLGYPIMYSKYIIENSNFKRVKKTKEFFPVNLPPNGGESNYLLERGLHQDTLDKFGVYYSMFRGFIIPLYVTELDNPIGWIERRQMGKMKYNYQPKHIPISLILYGETILKDKDRIFICEGALDVMYVTQLGFNAVGILGSSLSQEQLNKIREYKYKYCCSDNDEAGDRVYDDLVHAFPIHGRVQLPEGKDIFDLSEEEATKQLLEVKSGTGY
jgi:DNA primase